MKARIFILAAAVLFSTGGLAIKATGLGAWQVAGLRSGIACLVLVLVYPTVFRTISRRVWPVAIAYAATLLLFTLATKNTTAANAIFTQNASLFWILLLSRPLLGEPVGPKQIGLAFGLALGVLCLFLAVPNSQDTAPDPALGNAFAVGSSLASGLMILGIRGLARREEAGTETALAATVLGNGLLFLFCLPMMDAPVDLAPADWLWVVYLGAFQIALAYVWLVRGARGVPAFEISLLLLLEAVLNPLWTYLVLGERMGSLAVLGGGIVLGVLAVNALIAPAED